MYLLINLAKFACHCCVTVHENVFLNQHSFFAPLKITFTYTFTVAIIIFNSYIQFFFTIFTYVLRSLVFLANLHIVSKYDMSAELWTHFTYLRSSLACKAGNAWVRVRFKYIMI